MLITSYEDGLRLLQAHARPVKSKKLANTVALVAHAPSDAYDAWDTRKDGPLIRPQRVVLMHYSSRIVSWDSRTSNVHFFEAHPTDTTVRILNKFTTFSFWTRDNVLFLQGPGGPPTLYKQGQYTEQGVPLTSDGVTHWMGTVDVARLFARRRYLCDKLAHALLYGKIVEGWDAPLFAQPSSTARSLCAVLDGEAIRYDVVIALLANGDENVTPITVFTELGEACRPEGFRARWRPTRKLDKINKELTGPVHLLDRWVLHPSSLKTTVCRRLHRGLFRLLGIA